jgi:ribosomal-protein-alanine N-acetyltransferase
MTQYNYEDGLISDRLYTRKLVAEDAEAWASFFKDPEAIAYFPDAGGASPEERAVNWIEFQLTRYREQRFGLQALIHKTTGEFIGQCGLLAQIVDGEPEVEVGYHIFKKHWGQGYAPEAAKLFLDYGFKNLDTDSIVSIIDARNERSQSVANKNHLLREKQTTWSSLDIFIYRIFRSDWLKRRDI